MTDMLVRLYALPAVEPALARARSAGVSVRRARTLEKARVLEWVAARYAPWIGETEAAFAHAPCTCFVAVRDDALIGFACYDATCPNFFGPSAVDEAARGQGIGKALLLSTLDAQRQQGYAYAVIGGVGPAEFYAHCVGASPIAQSTPGIYEGLLRPRAQDTGGSTP
jgi:GNAT superfamily N-acetyltransferase